MQVEVVAAWKTEEALSQTGQHIYPETSIDASNGPQGLAVETFMHGCGSEVLNQGRVPNRYFQ